MSAPQQRPDDARPAACQEGSAYRGGGDRVELHPEAHEVGVRRGIAGDHDEAGEPGQKAARSRRPRRLTAASGMPARAPRARCPRPRRICRPNTSSAAYARRRAPPRHQDGLERHPSDTARGR